MTYKCWRCEEEWRMGHDCACDDRCPSCDATNEAVDVIEIGPDNVLARPEFCTRG
jgi:hypothetical protein